jgi:hypothetical protein
LVRKSTAALLDLVSNVKLAAAIVIHGETALRNDDFSSRSARLSSSAKVRSLEHGERTGEALGAPPGEFRGSAVLGISGAG